MPQDTKNAKAKATTQPPREGNGAGSYLANEDKGRDALSKPLKETAGEGAELSQEYLTAAAEGKGVILFEAIQATNQSFELIVTKKSDKSKMARIPSEKWMNMVPVEDMYWYVNIRGAMMKDAPTPADNNTTPAVAVAQHDHFRKTRKKRWFVFCHGYNVNENRAYGWNAEIFKRLHQMGSDAKFLSVSWEGSQGQINPVIPLLGGKTPDYWHNVYNAFKSSKALADVVNKLGDEDKVIAGHSLGNMLVSSAICDHGLNVEQYFMLNAAVPREAYFYGHINEDIAKMRNLRWKNLPSRVWSPFYWNLGFPSDDGRRKLTWRNRFSTMASKTKPHNYYSIEADVLHNGDGNIPSLLTDVAYKGEKAWAKQEIGKGSFLKKLTTGIKSADGGWAFNRKYDSFIPDPLDSAWEPSVNNVNTLTNVQLINEPFFKPFTLFYDAKKKPHSIHGSDGGVLANDYRIRAFLLAHDIPALSNPTGRNPVNNLGPNIKESNTDIVHKFKTGNFRWKHSSFKEEKMAHVWKLYADIVRRGKLYQKLRPPR